MDFEGGIRASLLLLLGVMWEVVRCELVAVVGSFLFLEEFES